MLVTDNDVCCLFDGIVRLAVSLLRTFYGLDLRSMKAEKITHQYTWTDCFVQLTILQ